MLHFPPMAPETRTPSLPKTARIDRALVRFVVTLYDSEGRPHEEVMCDPTILFRAALPDIWQAADVALPGVAAKLGAYHVQPDVKS